jgi:hypothetical protein
MTLTQESPYPAERDGGLRIPMPPHPVVAEQARALAEMMLASWDLGFLTDDALLVVSELVTNAMKLGEVFWFAICRQGRGVLIEATDTSPGIPKIEQADEMDVGGRGLLLVEAVSEEYGVRYCHDGGKTVWATVT